MGEPAACSTLPRDPSMRCLNRLFPISRRPALPGRWSGATARREAPAPAPAGAPGADYPTEPIRAILARKPPRSPKTVSVVAPQSRRQPGTPCAGRGCPPYPRRGGFDAQVAQVVLVAAAGRQRRRQRERHVSPELPPGGPAGSGSTQGRSRHRHRVDAHAVELLDGLVFALHEENIRKIEPLGLSLTRGPDHGTQPACPAAPGPFGAAEGGSARAANLMRLVEPEPVETRLAYVMKTLLPESAPDTESRSGATPSQVLVHAAHGHQTEAADRAEARTSLDCGASAFWEPGFRILLRTWPCTAVIT